MARWMYQIPLRRWVMRDRTGEIVDAVNLEDFSKQPRERQEVLNRAPVDDGRHDRG